MKKLGLFVALLAAMLLANAAWTTAALADDPILTKVPAVSAPPGPTSCDSVPAFFLSSCQLAWYGVKVLWCDRCRRRLPNERRAI